MIAVAVSGRERRWQVQQYGEWLVYTLPRRVTKKAKRSLVYDALLAGCRYYAPSGQGRFWGDSPLQQLSDEEYRHLRLPDPAVAAAKRLELPPARCPAQDLPADMPAFVMCAPEALSEAIAFLKNIRIEETTNELAQVLRSAFDHG